MSTYCPANPDHGLLLDLKGDYWYCPHSEHDHQPRVSPFFKDDQLDFRAKPRKPAFVVQEDTVESISGTATKVEAKSKASQARMEGAKMCAVCNGPYMPGEYGQHKELESHKAKLIVRPK